MKTYQRVRLKYVPSDLEETMTALCFKCGANGLSEALKFKQPNLAYEPTVLSSRNVDYDVYFSEVPGREFFAGVKELSDRIEWEITEEEEKDWLEEWKKGFEAFSLVGPYWIVPSWLESPVDEAHTIHIDPGMAFGTGTHATTQLAASFLGRKSKEMNPGAKPLTMLDVGTGTAVLAILARKMGMEPVVGLEIDPEACRVARENIVRNKVSHVEVLETPIDEIHQSYDVVIANIIDGVLIQLRKELLACTKPGGDLFLTGILLEREDHFLAEFVQKDDSVQIVKRWQNDEWIGFWVKKA